MYVCMYIYIYMYTYACMRRMHARTDDTTWLRDVLQVRMHSWHVCMRCWVCSQVFLHAIMNKFCSRDTYSSQIKGSHAYNTVVIYIYIYIYIHTHIHTCISHTCMIAHMHARSRTADCKWDIYNLSTQTWRFWYLSVTGQDSHDTTRHACTEAYRNVALRAHPMQGRVSVVVSSIYSLSFSILHAA